jgi:hypothetical protein
MAAATAFCEYVIDRVRPELRDEIRFILDQPQLGYNTSKRVYSVPFSSTPFQSLMVAAPKEPPPTSNPVGVAAPMVAPTSATETAMADVGRTTTDRHE